LKSKPGVRCSLPQRAARILSPKPKVHAARDLCSWRRRDRPSSRHPRHRLGGFPHVWSAATLRMTRLRKRIRDHNCFMSSRLCRISSRTRLCSALLSEEYSPCFQRERRDLARPSGVSGPVLAPPCIRHRPFGMPCRDGSSLHIAARFLGPRADSRFSASPFERTECYQSDFPRSSAEAYTEP
jgi:hypothetical protein